MGAAQAGRQQDAGHAGESGTQREGPDHFPADGNPRQHGGLPVAANGVQPPAEFDPIQDQPNDGRDADHPPGQRRQPHRSAPRQCAKPFGQAAEQRGAAGNPEGQAAEHGADGQSGDETGNAKHRDQTAGNRADQQAGQKDQRHGQAQGQPRLQQRNRGDPRPGDHGTDRQIELAEHHDQGGADGDDGQQRHLLGDVHQVVQAGEAVGCGQGEAGHDRDERQQCAVPMQYPHADTSASAPAKAASSTACGLVVAVAKISTTLPAAMTATRSASPSTSSRSLEATSTPVR